MNTPNLKIGDTVYLFDSNQRVYSEVTEAEKAQGKIWGDLIYRGHFSPLKITGETTGTWLLERRMVVNKKTLNERKTAFGQRRVFTAAQMEDKIYLHDNAQRIARAVEFCNNVNLLKQIDALLEKANVSV